jgi:adenosylcobinamide-phosphate synthase
VAGSAVEVWALPLAVAWDLLLGEPPVCAHPVVWMGNAARVFERRAPTEGAARQFAYGAALAVVPPLVYAAATGWGWRRLRGRPILVLALGVPLLKSTFAIRELRRAGAGVRVPLAAGDLAAAREGLRSLVSRDPAELTAPLIAAAAIESLAENLSDSIVAPLCYWALFGLPGAVAYRAINTLDAMIGYRGRYEWLGKAGARLDDAANLLPARLTMGLLLAAALAGEDVPRAIATARRDGRLTASPNAGWPMATVAGALGVELEKVGHYRLGAGGGVADAAMIARADRLVTLAAGGAALLAFGMRLLLGRGRK